MSALNSVVFYIPIQMEFATHTCRHRPYHVEYAGSRPITEAKQRWARLVLGRETAWEHRVLMAIFHFWNNFHFFSFIPFILAI